MSRVCKVVNCRSVRRRLWRFNLGRAERWNRDLTTKRNLSLLTHRLYNLMRLWVSIDRYPVIQSTFRNQINYRPLGNRVCDHHKGLHSHRNYRLQKCFIRRKWQTLNITLILWMKLASNGPVEAVTVSQVTSDTIVFIFLILQNNLLCLLLRHWQAALVWLTIWVLSNPIFIPYPFTFSSVLFVPHNSSLPFI